MSSAPPLVAGVDGCPAGWVAIVGARGDRLWMSVFRRFSDAIARHSRVASWAVDMPIGLGVSGPRESDAEARRRLGPKRSSSVFPAPPHAALADSVATYEEACERAQRATGKRISKQAWNLVPKIREVRGLLIAKPTLRRRVFETHPELTFARLAEGEGLAASKKTADGRRQRERLLGAEVGEEAVDRIVAQAEATRGLGADDALDAMACWLAARRAADGEDASIPATPPSDPDGLACCIRF